MTGRRHQYGIPERRKQTQAWLDLPANQETLRAAAKQQRVNWQLLPGLLQLLSERTYGDGVHAGCVAETEQQLAAALWLSAAQVRRLIKVLTDTQVLVVVKRPVSPGRGGGTGRAAVRRLTYLQPYLDDAAPVDNQLMTMRKSGNDHAPGTNDRAHYAHDTHKGTHKNPPQHERSEAPNATQQQVGAGARQTDTQANSTATNDRAQKPRQDTQQHRWPADAQNWAQDWLPRLTSDDSGLWPPTPAKNHQAVHRHRTNQATQALTQVLDQTQPGGQLAGYRSLVLRCTPTAKPNCNSDGTFSDHLPWQRERLEALLGALVGGKEQPDWIGLHGYLRRDQPTPPSTQPNTPRETPADPVRQLAKRLAV